MVRASRLNPTSPADSHDGVMAPVDPSVLESLLAIESSRSSPLEISQRGGASRLALYIDPQGFSRDCVGEGIAMRLSGWTLRSVPNIHDLSQSANPPTPSLIIFNSHAAGLTDTAVANQLTAIREFAPGAPLVIMSDLDEAAEV